MFRRFNLSQNAETKDVRNCSVVILLTLLLSPLASAQLLFEDHGIPVRDYDHIVGNLQPGDVIQFSDGKRFTVVRVLNPEGPGNTGLFVKTNKGLFKIPRGSGLLSGKSYGDWLDDYVEGYRFLKDTDIPIVEVDLGASRRWERVKVQELDIDFLLSNVIHHRISDPSPAYDRVSLSAAKRAAVMDGLLEFGASFWQFSHIADLGSSQVGWINGGWRLFDWGFPVDFADYPDASTSMSALVIPEPQQSRIFSETIRLRVQNRQVLAESARKKAEVSRRLVWDKAKWERQVKLIHRGKNALGLLSQVGRASGSWEGSFWKAIPSWLESEDYSEGFKGQLIELLKSQEVWPEEVWRVLARHSFDRISYAANIRHALLEKQTWPDFAVVEFERLMNSRSGFLPPDYLEGIRRQFTILKQTLGPTCLDWNYSKISATYSP